MSNNNRLASGGSMRSNQRVLECRDLRKSFGDLVAVNGISFHISEGETYGLLGPMELAKRQPSP